MNVFSDGKEVGIPSGPSGPGGLIARLRSRFGILATLAPSTATPPIPVLPEPPPILAETAAVPHDTKRERLPPGFPADAVLVVADENGHYPDDRRFKAAYMWTWVNASKWHYISDFPIPAKGHSNE